MIDWGDYVLVQILKMHLGFIPDCAFFSNKIDKNI